jgi:acetyl-CoA acetyltransferase
VIVAAKRTPVGRAGGVLATVDITGLLSAVLTDVVEAAGIDPPRWTTSLSGTPSELEATWPA